MKPSRTRLYVAVELHESGFSSNIFVITPPTGTCNLSVLLVISALLVTALSTKRCHRIRHRRIHSLRGLLLWSRTGLAWKVGRIRQRYDLAMTLPPGEFSVHM